MTTDLQQDAAAAGGVDFLSRLAETARVASLLDVVAGAAPSTADGDTAPVPLPMQAIGTLLREMPWGGRGKKRRRDVARRKAEHIDDPWMLPLGDLFSAMNWRGGGRSAARTNARAPESAPEVRRAPPGGEAARDAGSIAW